MFQIDPSIFEAIELVARPFKTELHDFWKYVRALCLGALIITVTVWTFAYFASSEQFANARRILNITGWFMLIVFVFSYISLIVEAHYNQKEKHEEKVRKIREF